MNMINDEQVTAQDQSLQCPVCGQPLSFRLARGRKSGKPFLMVMCLHDGRHFRGFIGDRGYLAKLLEHLEQGQVPVNGDQP
jgi:predicted RNA-binding Zn-ribbon protein involved in translation (DUF1610 family)